MLPLLQTDTRKIYTVSEVTRDIRGLLEDNFPTIWLSGEISNFRTPSSGHFYFTLKDESAQIAAVMFRGNNHSLKFSLKDGLGVIVHGRVTVYEPRGQYQIVVDSAEPKGLGALQLAFEQLKEKLAGEGLFDEKHKKPIPLLPRKVGIITSSQGAALHDMVTILTRRFPNLSILINPVRVQGDGATKEIAQAIAEMNARSDVDVLIVGRGGGSLEDLWAFNEEIVVRAVFASDIPIISAVGHETDFSLSDLAADLRAPTPSAAAELAAPEKEELLTTLSQHRSSLKFAVGQFLKGLAGQIAFLRRQIKDPRRVLEDWKMRVDDMSSRALQAQKRNLKELRLRIEGLRRHFESLSPHAPLKRGYSIVFKEGQKIPLRSPAGVIRGELLEIRLGEGSLRAKVV
ncbi:MAG: exodeoxyribonuclease VII large subunit [Deltaproteobacteria bacterium]|nr:exodeoxyribonuclease VII large subunit [Deltaproteobacteria bacterium]